MLVAKNVNRMTLAHVLPAIKSILIRRALQTVHTDIFGPITKKGFMSVLVSALYLCQFKTHKKKPTQTMKNLHVSPGTYTNIHKKRVEAAAPGHTGERDKQTIKIFMYIIVFGAAGEFL